MNNERFNRILSYVVVALLSVTVTLAAVLGVIATKRQATDKLIQLEELILNRFIGEADQTVIEDAAAYAMVGALGDKWSYYIPASSYQQYLEGMKNAYVGVGITIAGTENNSGLQVVDVVAGAPAEEAGVQVGDVVIKLDGQPIAGMGPADAKKLIQGKTETTVEFGILRDGRELTLQVVRREIKRPAVKSQLLPNGIGLVNIVNFKDNCASETIAAIEQLKKQGATKMIFDVRNNPGGYAEELVELLDYLLPEGKLFTRVYYTGAERTDMSDAWHLDMPMAVLINGQSYSAAEFFAAALAEYDVATVVGERTVGKGYFQSTYELPDGSAVGLSTGKYYTPKGVSLADVGVTPHVTVAVDDATAGKIVAGQLEPMEDPQILSAIAAFE